VPGAHHIVIAHRLHTVVDADRIFFIEDGAWRNPVATTNLFRKGGSTASFLNRLHLLNQCPSPPVAVRVP